MALAVGIATTAAQVHVRELPWDPGAKIQDRLSPDDDQVVLTRAFLDVVVPAEEMSAKQVIEDASVRSDLVLVAKVDSVQAVLALEESWVDTQLLGTVRVVVRTSGRKKLRPGDPLNAHISGGAIRIGNVHVLAGDSSPVTPPIVREHEEYLLFLALYGDTLYPTHPPLLIQDGRLTYLSPFHAPRRPANPMEGMQLREVVPIVQRAQARNSGAPTTLAPIGK